MCFDCFIDVIMVYFDDFVVARPLRYIFKYSLDGADQLVHGHFAYKIAINSQWTLFG